MVTSPGKEPTGGFEPIKSQMAGQLSCHTMKRGLSLLLKFSLILATGDFRVNRGVLAWL